MTPREIIAEAWAITGREQSLRRWGFTSSLFETLLNLKLVVYQVYFFYEFVFRGGAPGFFDVEIAIYHALPFWGFLTIIIIFILMVVIEFFMPSLCLGAIIGLAAKSFRKEEVKGGLVLGIYNFFPLFAARELFVFSRITTTITVVSLILRYVDDPLKMPAVIAVIGLWLLSSVLRFFSSFAEEAIVIRKTPLFTAIGRSFKMLLSNLSHVMFLILLLLVISVRIVINAIMVLIIPSVVIGLAFLLANFLSNEVSYTIAGIVGVALVLIASYFFAYLHVFKQTVWTITYMIFSEKKDLDIIVADEGGGTGEE